MEAQQQFSIELSVICFHKWLQYVQQQQKCHYIQKRQLKNSGLFCITLYPNSLMYLNLIHNTLVTLVERNHYFLYFF